MPTLISPGTSVQIIDDSFFISGRAGTIPLIFIATGDEKTQIDGITPAIGTYESGVLRTVTSTRQALELYGTPKFHTSANGTPHHGDARNEYGLDALFKFLQVGNRAYVVRANVNLNDDIESVKNMWDRKMVEAAALLRELVEAYIEAVNADANLVPGDTGYVEEIDDATLIDLINEALSDVFASYSFSKDQFSVKFMQDHTVDQPGFIDVMYSTAGGFITGSDILGLEAGEEYTAAFDITHSGGAEVVQVTINGSDVTTFADLIDELNDVFAGRATAQILQGRIRVTSDLDGATSKVEIIEDGGTASFPLFASTNLFVRIGDAITGEGANTLSIYNETYTTIIGSYDGVEGLISAGAGSWDGDAAEELILTAALEFAGTKEFKFLTSLGTNDAARRTAIVQQLQAAVNDPNSGIRSEGLEYDLVACPGYFEVTDELANLSVELEEEVFVIGETPLNRPPTGPNSIVTWARSPQKVASRNVGYWYGHGISSNIDGANIMSTSATIALRTIAFSDRETARWFAPAGVQRGQCPYLTDIGYVSGELGGPTTFITNELDRGTRDALYEQPVNINPITFLPGQGILVFGQKTSQGFESALDRINVSRLVKFVKREIRKGLVPYTFEPNDAITRDNVKATTNGFLFTLLDRRALQDFAVQCDEDNNGPNVVDANEMYVDVALKPTRAAEFIYARINVVRSGVEIGGTRE